MESRQEKLNSKLKERKSIAWYARGYYIARGGVHGFDIKVPVFDFPEFLITSQYTPPKSRTIKVLIEAFGEMMWINIKLGDLYYNKESPFSCAKKASLLRFQLESIKA